MKFLFTQKVKVKKMKKLIFTSILGLVLVLLFLPVNAARDYYFDFGDQFIWEPIDETYIEGQYEKEQGPIRVSRNLGIGWYKPGNAVEVLDQVDFGEGIISMAAQVAALYEVDHFENVMPDAHFQIRIDSYDGPIIAKVKPVGTGGWDILEDAEVTITDEGKEVKGTHTIFIVNQIGEAQDYIDGTIKGSCNFCVLEIETDADKPTSPPTKEPTPTLTPTPSPTKEPTSKPAEKDEGTNMGTYIVLGIFLGLLVIAIITIVVIRKKKK